MDLKLFGDEGNLCSQSLAPLVTLLPRENALLLLIPIKITQNGYRYQVLPLQQIRDNEFRTSGS